MKRLALLCGALLLFAGIASAQGESPKVEVFGGYSFLRASDSGASANFNGASGSVAYNLSPWLGLVSDVGGYHWSQAGNDATVVSYLFGPKFAYRHGPVTPFAQVLFGGAHLSGSANNCVFGGGTCTGSSEAFAMALGGGMDWNATPHIGIRLAQVEYLMTKFNDVSGNDRQNNVRVSTGVVFRW
jgi:peptidoglycan-associated lipoprotein